MKRVLNISLVSFGLTLALFSPLRLNQPFQQTAQVKSATSYQSAPPHLKSLPLPQISAAAVEIYHPSSKTILFQKNATAGRYPASLTKLMTALVSLQSYQLDQVLVIKSAPATIGHTIDLLPADRLTVESLLYALLVSSGNDAALTLAENYPSGYSGFVQAMNQKARQLHLDSARFTNVSGLDDSNHQISAHDLSLLAAQVIQNPFLRRVISTPNTTVYNADHTHNYYLETTNELLDNKKVFGIKTGWTEEAGENLITLVKANNHQFIITVMGSQDRFTDSALLIDWLTSATK